MLLCAVSCIRNDIPYPVIVAEISSLEVEGAKSVSIDKSARKVTIFLEEQTDIRSVKILSILYSDPAVVPSWDIRGIRDLSSPLKLTLTTFDEELCRKIEPNVSTTGERAAALRTLHEAGIPTVVWLCPILPFINDTEENIRGILAYCREAQVYGVICFGMGLTLREGNREYFYRQLDRLFPGMKEKYIRTYGMQYQLSSPRNRELMGLFHRLCEDYGIVHDNQQIFAYLNELESRNHDQLSLFDA